MNPTTNAGAGSVIALDAGHLALAACLVLVCGVASVWLRLGLERQLAIASLRTVVQLLLIGYVLRWVFGLNNVALLLVLFILMIALASHAAVDRVGRAYKGVVGDAFVTLALSGLVTTFTVTQAVIAVTPWYRPQYVVPLLGMVLGSTLTGVSLCLDQLLDTLAERRAPIEMELSLGASRWEAAREPLGDAVRKGMVPTINAMMVVGIVSLPGMMTGQILAGVDPLTAVRYQIVVMFLIAAANTLGCIGIALLAFRRLFNRKHQLEAGRIARRR